jgi:hypothetical protein
VRSSLQHLWAELSEKLSDVVDPAIKYGGGDEEFRQMLEEASTSVAKVEEWEKRITTINLPRLTKELPASVQEGVASVLEHISILKRDFAEIFQRVISKLGEYKGEDDLHS